jgi:hypothetical protein
MPEPKSSNPVPPSPFRTQFRRFLIPMELFILATCGVFYYQTGDWLACLVLLLCMQAFGFAGAAWSAMLAKRAANRTEQLPLARRRR